MTCIFKRDNRFSGCCDDIVIAILHNQKRIFSRPQLWLDCRICLVSCSGRSTIHPQPSLRVRKRDRNCRHPISLCLVFVLVLLSFVFFLLFTMTNVWLYINYCHGLLLIIWVTQNATWLSIITESSCAWVVWFFLGNTFGRVLYMDIIHYTLHAVVLLLISAYIFN